MLMKKKIFYSETYTKVSDSKHKKLIPSRPVPICTRNTIECNKADVRLVVRFSAVTTDCHEGTL